VGLDKIPVRIKLSIGQLHETGGLLSFLSNHISVSEGQYWNRLDKEQSYPLHLTVSQRCISNWHRLQIRIIVLALVFSTLCLRLCNLRTLYS